MRKVTAILIGIVLLLIAVPVFAADSGVNPELSRLHREILQLRKQIIDVRIQDGEITADEGDLIKAQLEERHHDMEKEDFNRPGHCHSTGPAGENRGKGFFGGGMKGMMHHRMGLK
jgi:hypothetical protein